MGVLALRGTTVAATISQWRLLLDVTQDYDALTDLAKLQALTCTLYESAIAAESGGSASMLRALGQA